jgi:hypothetical protein
MPNRHCKRRSWHITGQSFAQGRPFHATALVHDGKSERKSVNPCIPDVEASGN